MIKHILPPLRRVELTINYGAGSIVEQRTMIPKPKIAPQPAGQGCEPCGCEVVDESITGIIVEMPGDTDYRKDLREARREAGEALKEAGHYSKKELREARRIAREQERAARKIAREEAQAAKAAAKAGKRPIGNSKGCSPVSADKKDSLL